VCYTVSNCGVTDLVGHQREPELLAHRSSEEAAHRVLLPAAGRHHGRDRVEVKVRE
jgi:hypothetical protein